MGIFLRGSGFSRGSPPRRGALSSDFFSSPEAGRGESSREQPVRTNNKPTKIRMLSFYSFNSGSSSFKSSFGFRGPKLLRRSGRHQAVKDRFRLVAAGGDRRWRILPGQVVEIIGLIAPLPQLLQTVGIAFASFALQVRS